MRPGVPDLRGVMAATVGCLGVATDFGEAEASPIAAMAATAVGLGKRIAAIVELAHLEELVVRGKNGYLVVYAAGDKGVRAVQAVSGANVGLIHLEAQEVTARVAQILA